MIKIYRMNTGSSGACDAELNAAVALHSDLAWASDPFEADVLVLTGPQTFSAKPAFQALLAALGGEKPLLAVGRSAIDGHPYGRGGLAEDTEIVAQHKLDGDPPTPAAIAAAVRECIARGTNQ